MYENPVFFSNIRIPRHLQELIDEHSTKISVSKVRQFGVICGYGDREDWLVGVHIITDICQVCGTIKTSLFKAGKLPRCSRHNWEYARAILLFHTNDSDLQVAFDKAGEEAERLLTCSGNWYWRVERFLSEDEYLERRELRRENEQLREEIESLRRQMDSHFQMCNLKIEPSHWSGKFVVEIADSTRKEEFHHDVIGVGEGYVVREERPMVIANTREKPEGEPMLFHHPKCRSLPSPKYRKKYDSIEAARFDGYLPCQLCHHLHGKKYFALRKIKTESGE